jgi:hypothetical protein
MARTELDYMNTVLCSKPTICGQERSRQSNGGSEGENGALTRQVDIMYPRMLVPSES